MNIDVSACIAELLYKHDSVIIPDFGGIVGVYESAQIDHVQGMLHPPSLALRFNENLVINDGVLISYLRNKYNLNLEDAQELVRAHVELLHKKLSKKEIIILPKIGRLYRDYENELRFLQDSDNFHTDAFGLPDIQFFPILRTRETALREAPLPTVNAVPESTGSRSWLRQLVRQDLVPIAAGFLILVIAVSILYTTQVGETTGEFEAKPVADRFFNQKPAQETRSSILDYVAPPKEEVKTEAPVEKISPEVEVLDEDFETELDTEASTLAPQEKVCYIITGAFGQKSSVQKRLDQLIDLGFAPYQDKKGKLTRVGIQFAYQSPADIEEKMAILHDKVESKSWILDQ